MRVDSEEFARTFGNGVAAADRSDVPVKRSAAGPGSLVGDVGKEGGGAAAAWLGRFASHPRTSAEICRSSDGSCRRSAYPDCRARGYPQNIHRGQERLRSLQDSWSDPSLNHSLIRVSKLNYTSPIAPSIPPPLFALQSQNLQCSCHALQQIP